jgi:ABC-2 type transport system ATP-binding protein
MERSVHAVGLTKRFGPRTALDSVDLGLSPGVVGLLGPNGAGKTTLLRILATVMAPDQGDLELLGHRTDTADGRLEIRRRLGYLPQEPGFHRHFTAFEFVDYVAILKEWGERKGRHDEVRRVLSLVGLEDRMHTRIRDLSGGMRRRVAIAQSLIGSPALLLLDEPTAGLDPEQRLRFRELLGTAAGGATVIISTHQTDDVAALCQRVLVLLEGRMHFEGSAVELAAVASERVWVAPERQLGAALAWVTAEGKVRHLGTPPAGATVVEPTVEDGYLLLCHDAGVDAEGSASESAVA